MENARNGHGDEGETDGAQRRRRGRPPGGYYVTHHSVASHRKTIRIFNDNDLYATWHRLHLLASERRAGRRDDWVSLSPEDVHAVTKGADWRTAVRRLERVCKLQEWPFEWYEEDGEVRCGTVLNPETNGAPTVHERCGTVPKNRMREWAKKQCCRVQIRNFTEKQGLPSSDIVRRKAKRTNEERCGTVPHTPHTYTNIAPTYSLPEKTEENTTELVVAAAPQTTLPGLTLVPIKKPRPEVTAAEVVEAFRRICVPLGAHDVNEITASRRKKLQLRLREHPSFDWWDELFQAIASVPFFFGHNDRGWCIDLDWLVANDKNGVRILEGRYRRNGRTQRQATR